MQTARTSHCPSPARARRCLGPEQDRPSAQELLHDSFFLRRIGKGDSAKSLSTQLPAVTPALTPRSSRRSETEGSDTAIHCQVGPMLERLPAWDWLTLDPMCCSRRVHVGPACIAC